jgi:glutathione S-transferase
MPTLELADGSVIRDSGAISDYFEEDRGHTFSPVTPKQRIVSRLFDVIGAEGLMRPAMHYRWNFDAENLEFIMSHMNMITPSGDIGLEMADKIAGQMRKATVSMGVIPETHDFVEALYAEQLAALNKHFAAYPYLLGGRPCMGDFGLMSPLFAHLGRDPKPLSLMQARGVNVFRWLERMNRREADLVGFECKEETYLDNDEIPGTLMDLLSTMAQDFVPETLAAAEVINGWIAEQDELLSGTQCLRGVGFAEFDVSGTTIPALAQPYRYYLLKRVQDVYASLDTNDKVAVDAMLEACNMAPVLSATLTRDVGLQNNLEVWL